MLVLQFDNFIGRWLVELWDRAITRSDAQILRAS
jgi:hypothetical protein